MKRFAPATSGKRCPKVSNRLLRLSSFCRPWETTDHTIRSNQSQLRGGRTSKTRQERTTGTRQERTTKTRQERTTGSVQYDHSRRLKASLASLPAYEQHTHVRGGHLGVRLGRAKESYVGTAVAAASTTFSSRAQRRATATTSHNSLLGRHGNPFLAVK